jgi:hypothetical protein
MKRLTSFFGTHWQQWAALQSAFNETCRKFFIEGFTPNMRIIYDDDKMHCEVSNKTDMQGLKKMQHVRDNRKGFEVHTACYTASGLPIGIEFERSNNDSTTAATERLSRSQLSPISGQSGVPMLLNTEVAMDREGFKGIFLKTLDIKIEKYQPLLTVMTLGISTFEQTRHWDLVLENPLDNRAEVDEQLL